MSNAPFQGGIERFGRLTALAVAVAFDSVTGIMAWLIRLGTPI
jgi:hypothetical protein